MRAASIECEKAAASVATVRGLLAAYWDEHVEPNVVNKAVAQCQRNNLLAHFADMHPSEVMPADVRAFVRKRRAGEIGGCDAKGGRTKRAAQNPTIRRDLTQLVAVAFPLSRTLLRG